jgi:glutathione S-transferase
VPFELTLASATMGPSGHVSSGAKPYGIVDTPAYRAMNPNGSVPTIDDDGYILWESNAIVCYLALTYGAKGLSGDGPGGLAQQMKWMSWTNEHLEPALHTLVMECVRLAPEQRSPPAIEAARIDTIPDLQRLDQLLASQAYVAGDDFGIADIPVACAVYRWMLFELETPALPHLQTWFARVSARPGFITHVLPRHFHLG